MTTVTLSDLSGLIGPTFGSDDLALFVPTADTHSASGAISSITGTVGAAFGNGISYTYSITSVIAGTTVILHAANPNATADYELRVVGISPAGLILTTASDATIDLFLNSTPDPTLPPNPFGPKFYILGSGVVSNPGKTLTLTLGGAYSNLPLSGVTLTGTAGNDVLTGTPYHDVLSGGDGNDTLISNGGNDDIDGGRGIDTVVLPISHTEANVSHRTGNSFTVQTSNLADTVSNVELFLFNDGIYAYNYITQTTLFGAESFTLSQAWPTQDTAPRLLADVNGDGFADIVAFGQSGTQVSFGSSGLHFGTPTVALANFGQAQGWSSDKTFHREVADVNHDGRADIVGFGIGGVLVSLAHADGSFAAPTLGSTNFNQANGWSNDDAFTRTLGDVNGDGFADVVGFGIAGTFVALGKGDGTFGAAQFALADFGARQGWTSDNTFHRTMGDVNGDGRADIVGFGIAGTYVALGQADGTFSSPTLAQANFGISQGWTNQDTLTRLVGDVNGDGRADIVGLGATLDFIAFGQSDGSFSAAAVELGVVGNGFAAFNANTNTFSNQLFPRQLIDIDHNGRADIVQFGDTSLQVAFSSL